MRVGGNRSGFQKRIRQRAEARDEQAHELGVELRAGAAFEFGHGFLSGAALLVCAVGRDRVVGVGDGHDARTERYLVAVHAVGIAGAIEIFVVMADDPADARDGAQRLQNFRAEGYVLFHRLPLFGIQRAVLIQNIFRDADLADVVKQRAQANFLGFDFVHSQRLAQQHGVSRHFQRVTLRVVVLRVDRQRE